MEISAERGQAGCQVPFGRLAWHAVATFAKLGVALRPTMAGRHAVVLLVLAIVVSGPAGADSTFSPIWSDNEDGRAHVLPGPAPDYGSSLSAEYSIGGGVVTTLTRGDVDGIPSTVWLTKELGGGAHDLRWRWVVDGVPQKWSGGNRVSVTAKSLAKSNTIDAFGDGSVKLTLDRAYQVGQFEDGEWYAVAPQGLTVTRATPEQKGSGKSLRHGATVDIDFLDQGLDGRGQGFDQARASGSNIRIEPGSVLVKAMSQPDGKRNSHIERMATLTVLSERPPAGSFRPTVYANGGRALRNEAEIDLDRVPRIDYDPHSFPGLDTIKDWRLEQLTRPAPPLGGGSAGARKLYPEGQASAYHRTQRQDLTLPAHLIMASNLTDEGERMALAKALIQREIDILGSFASKKATGAGGSPPYHWVTPTVFAGTLLRDPKMRGADALGLAPGDYNFDLQRYWKYSTWEDNEAFAALPEAEKKAFSHPFRDLDKAGHDTGKKGVEVWAPLLEERRVRFNPRREDAEDLEALGITYNGDGTWTIPENRFADGGLYQWFVHRGPEGERRLLHPSQDNPYTAQHAVQAVTMAPVLKAVAGEDYLANRTSISGATAWELYSGYAQQWMRQSPEWMAALGFKLHKSYPYQRGDSTTAGTNDQRGFSTDFIDKNYLDRWEAYAPVFTPTVPESATRQMFTLTGLDEGFEFRLDDIPHDGWARLTDVEIRIDDGTWISTGLTNIGQTYTHGITAGAYLVAMRAVNVFGAGEASGGASVDAGSATAPDRDRDGSAGGRPGNGGTEEPRRNDDTDDDPEDPRRTENGGSEDPRRADSDEAEDPRRRGSGVAEDPRRAAASFASTAWLEARGEFGGSFAAVPVPASLPLLLGALTGLGVLRLRRRQRTSVR